MRPFWILQWRSVVVAVLGMGLLGWAGCGGDAKLPGETGTVIGKVTYQGKPVPAGTTVSFVNQENAMAAVGQTMADGTYTLMMRGERKVLTGPYRISVNPAAVTQDLTADPEAYKAIMEGQVKAPGMEAAFPEKYKSPETSGLAFSVQPGSNIYDIDLKDDKE